MEVQIPGEPLQFVLNDKTPSSDLKLICQAPSEEVKENWTSQLRSILDMQGNMLRGKCTDHPRDVYRSSHGISAELIV